MLEGTLLSGVDCEEHERLSQGCVHTRWEKIYQPPTRLQRLCGAEVYFIDKREIFFVCLVSIGKTDNQLLGYSWVREY